MSVHDWQQDGACHGKDLTLFFGPEGERQAERERRERKAKAWCGQCRIRQTCLDYAITHGEKYGVWGGLNPDERASAKRRRARHGEDVPDDKQCVDCGETKPASQFSRNSRAADRLANHCKACDKVRRSDETAVAS